MPALKRIALVLGAGGVVGHAFESGVLAGLAEATGWDARQAELIVGTSAGSYVAAMLRAGIGPADLLASLTRERLSSAGAALLRRMRAGAAELPFPDPPDAAPGRGPAAPEILLHAARSPWRIRPVALAAAMLPAGRQSTAPIERPIAALHPPEWPALATWVCAVRLRDGALVVFGKAGAPVAPLARAVAASCAIPAYFRPVEIDGERYVDGGVHSVTNADLVAGFGYDLAIVVAPMAATREALSFGPEAAVRAAVRARLRTELARIRRSGTPAITFLPTPADRAAMGGNPMSGSRRHEIAKAARESTLRRLEDAEIRARLAVLTAA